MAVTLDVIVLFHDWPLFVSVNSLSFAVDEGLSFPHVGGCFAALQWSYLRESLR